jgi:hypothetical protein
MKSQLFLIVLLIFSTASHAQTRKSAVSKSRSSRTTPTNWGIGLRLGDPTGLSAKKYLSNGRALEFNLGSSGNWGYDYRDRFYDNDDFRTYDYLGYKRNGAVSLQAHLLFQTDFPDAKGLQWYWGFGPQLRFNTYTYNYRYDGGNAWIYVTETVTDNDFGADAIIGLEYYIPNAPLSVFADVNVLLELFDNPFSLFGQGGLGIRYNLK